MVGDARGDVDLELLLGADASVALTLGAGLLDHRASPAQVGHGDTDTNCPNIERAARRTSPVLAQVAQLVALVPGAARAADAVQRSRVRTFTFLVVRWRLRRD